MVNPVTFKDTTYVTLSDYKILEEESKSHKEACARVVRAVNEVFQLYALADQKKKATSALEQMEMLRELIQAKRGEWSTGAYSFIDPKDIDNPMEWVNEFFRVHLNLKDENAKYAVKKYTERILLALDKEHAKKVDKINAERTRLREKAQVLISAMKLLLNGAIDDEV